MNWWNSPKWLKRREAAVWVVLWAVVILTMADVVTTIYERWQA